MSLVKRWIPLLVAVSLISVAFAWLFQLRLGGGDLYPEYSSLRADAIGTRALYEALELMPGIEVKRDYRPLPKLGARPRLLMLPGLIWQEWQSVPAKPLAALNAMAGGGARLVLAFRADQKREERDKTGHPVSGDTDEKEKKAKSDAASADKREADKTKKKTHRPDPEEMKDLAKEWGITLKQRWLMPAQDGAKLVEGISEGLPSVVAWHSDLYFSIAPSTGWRVLYRRAGEPVLVEKKFGRGSIVLVADAYFLSNEAMHRDRATPLLSWLVGDYRQITFVESTLGVLEDNGVGFLARRYGLGGALALCALLGVLYAWRRLVAFVPTLESDAAESVETLAYEPAAGFTTLLRRSLGPTDVLRACVEEWRKGQRGAAANQSKAARLEATWQANDPKKPLSSNYNALARSLKPR